MCLGQGTFMCPDTDWGTMHSNGRWVAPLAIAVAFILVLTSVAPVGAVWEMDERLPDPVAMTCAVSTGLVMYVFGGATKGALLDTIYAVDPESGRTSVLSFTLPTPRKLASAVWTGDAAYIIGGIGYDGEPIPEIVKFVPGVGVRVIEGAMPYGTKGIPSVWSGEAIYILGNCQSSEEGQYDIIRFDPVNETTEILEDVLPIMGAGSSATWAGDCAYIVGGRHNVTQLSDRIIRYVPGEGAEYMEARLPQGRIGAASAWNGSAVYAFGGTIALLCGPLECVPTDYLDEMVVFHPGNDTVEVFEGALPRPMDLRAALYFDGNDGTVSSRILIPGGLSATGPVDWIMVTNTEPFLPPPTHDRPIFSGMVRFLVDYFWLFMVVTIGIGFGVMFLTGPYRQRKKEEHVQRFLKDLEDEPDE